MMLNNKNIPLHLEKRALKDFYCWSDWNAMLTTWRLGFTSNDALQCFILLALLDLEQNFIIQNIIKQLLL